MPDLGGGSAASRPLVIGCGALARELVELTRRAGFPEVDLTCLPATLHNRPEQIPDAVRARIRKARTAGRDRIFVAYADCGTGGMLDRVLAEEDVARLAGAHCYEVYAGRAAFAALAEAEPGTFYLTDFLARNFERLVWRGLGLDRHPELLPQYFGNYTRLVYLAQTDDPALTAAARRGARRLGLRYERRFTDYGELTDAIVRLDPGAAAAVSPASPRDPAPSTQTTSRGDRQSAPQAPGAPRGTDDPAGVTPSHGQQPRPSRPSRAPASAPAMLTPGHGRGGAPAEGPRGAFLRGSVEAVA